VVLFSIVVEANMFYHLATSANEKNFYEQEKIDYHKLECMECSLHECDNFSDNNFSG